MRLQENSWGLFYLKLFEIIYILCLIKNLKMNWNLIKKEYPLFFDMFSKDVDGFINETDDYETGRWWTGLPDQDPWTESVPKIMTIGGISTWMFLKGFKVPLAELSRGAVDPVGFWADTIYFCIDDAEKKLESFLHQEYEE